MISHSLGNSPAENGSKSASLSAVRDLDELITSWQELKSEFVMRPAGKVGFLEEDSLPVNVKEPQIGRKPSGSGCLR